MPAGSASYTIEDGVLTPRVALDSAFAQEFEKACRRLLDCPERELVIDLSRHNYLTSTYLGVIGSVAAQARDRGKNLLVKVSNQLARFFSVVQLDRIVRVETAAP